MRRNFFSVPFVDARRLACLMTKIFRVRRRGFSLAADKRNRLGPVVGRTNDDEIGRWVAIVTRLIEPLFMTVIGLLIGVIVVLMYFPIFQLAGSVQ